MYSIILVDDERSLRESIEHIVDWEGNGFHLIGTAQNGLDALELMENDHVPDVVITDIKMPVMDGIELAKKLRDEYPTIKIVFLSGYDEFQYAVEGIRLNVVSYLLKPISKDEIENCLNDLKNTLDEEIQAVNDMSRISGEYQKNLELMKISFLNSLLTEERFEGINNELEEVLKTHELEFFNRGKILFTIRFVENQASNNQKKNTEFLRFSLLQVIQDIVKKYSESEVFLFSSYVVCILTGNLKELDEMKDILTKDIIASTLKLMNEKVVIGVSEYYLDIFKTSKAYRETLTALDYTKPEEEEYVVFIGDVENTSSKTEFLEEVDERSLLLAIKTNDIEFVKNTLDNFFDDKYYNEHNRFTVLRTIISTIYMNCIRALRETVGEVDDKFNYRYQQIFDAVQYDERTVIKKELISFCEDTMQVILQNRAQTKNSLILDSMEYLKENFSDPDLTLQSISSYLNVSSSYFSTIFKKETGKSFIDTLTEMKMKKAKELVLMTNDKMFEIAFECGYDDQHYFSYSFKKYFGVSPTKMRKDNIAELTQL